MIGALVALRPDSDATPESLTTLCKEQLSSYKVPTVWRLVDESAYPTGATGKVDRAVAREMIEAARATFAAHPHGNRQERACW